MIININYIFLEKNGEKILNGKNILNINTNIFKKMIIFLERRNYYYFESIHNNQKLQETSTKKNKNKDIDIDKDKRC